MLLLGSKLFSKVYTVFVNSRNIHLLSPVVVYCDDERVDYAKIFFSFLLLLNQNYITNGFRKYIEISSSTHVDVMKLENNNKIFLCVEYLYESYFKFDIENQDIEWVSH